MRCNIDLLQATWYPIKTDSYSRSTIILPMARYTWPWCSSSKTCSCNDISLTGTCCTRHGLLVASCCADVHQDHLLCMYSPRTSHRVQNPSFSAVSCCVHILVPCPIIPRSPYSGTMVSVRHHLHPTAHLCTLQKTVALHLTHVASVSAS